jgi:hypothetical protein
LSNSIRNSVTPRNPKFENFPNNWREVADRVLPTHFYDENGAIAYSLTPQQRYLEAKKLGQCGVSVGLVGSCINDENTPTNPFRTMRVTVNRGLVIAKCYQPIAPKGGLRGKVGAFTRASRKRMLERVASVREVEPGVFITLTYPDNFPSDERVWARDRAVFVQRLLYKFPTARGVWRKEIKTRLTGELNAGKRAPHYHLIVWGIPNTSGEWLLDLIQWVSAAWFATHGIDHAAQGRAGTRVEMIWDMRHALRYTAKYCAKTDGAEEIDLYGGLEKFGRHWGTFGTLDTSQSFECWLSYEQLIELRRMAARWLKSRKSPYWRRVSRMHKGFSVFGLGDTNEFGKTDLFATVFSMLEKLFEIKPLRSVTTR